MRGKEGPDVTKPKNEGCGRPRRSKAKRKWGNVSIKNEREEGATIRLQ